MKALELLKMYQYADDCLDGIIAEELNDAITELEALESKLIECMEKYTDLEFTLIKSQKMEVIINGVVYVPKETKTETEYPIFKRNEDGEVFKYHSNGNITCYFSNDSIGQVFTEYNAKVCKFDTSSTETIPYDAKRCLYQLQPVWCWDNAHKSKVTMFYDVELKMAIGFSAEKGNEYHWDNIEPITPEQLKVMPFIWSMYQKVLKDKQ